MGFKRTTAINKLLKLTKRKKVVQGSTSAGKTYGIIPVLINYATTHKRKKITVVAETLPAVKEGALDIFKIIMEETGRWRDANWNASSLTYTFSGTKTRIQFKSFDTVGKAKASGKRDVLFLNEANHIPYEIADTLMTRSDSIWIDFNPDVRFWAHEIVETEPNSEFLLLTYKDNEACPPAIIEELETKMRRAFFDPSGDWESDDNIKSKYWANWCRVYVRGMIGVLEGAILTDWEIVNSIPSKAVLVGYGVDFGKGGSDPTTTTGVWYYDGLMYWDEIVYQAELRDETHAQKLKDAGVSALHPMACDNSEPTKIKELARRGFPKAIGPKKETIEYGIGLLHRYPIRVTSRSINIITELRRWKRDGDGAPIDDYNHAIDGVRYLYTVLMSPSQPKPKKRGGYKTR